MHEDPIHGYAPLGPGVLPAMLARQLEGTPFREQYQAVDRRLGSLREASSERVSVESEISVWDRLNIFRTTEAEARRDALKQQIGGLREELGEQRERLAARFWEALRSYPPALLRAEVDAVVQAVDDIRAVCRSYTVSRGTGKNRRTERRYKCELVGKAEAVRAMTRWSALMVQVFGEQLGYHELLEALELEPVAGEAAQS